MTCVHVFMIYKWRVLEAKAEFDIDLKTWVLLEVASLTAIGTKALE